MLSACRPQLSNRGIDSLGGGHLLRGIDSLGGGHLLRGLDSMGGGHLLRGIDSLGGGHLLRGIDSLGGGHLLRGIDSLGGGNLLREANSQGNRHTLTNTYTQRLLDYYSKWKPHGKSTHPTNTPKYKPRNIMHILLPVRETWEIIIGICIVLKFSRGW